MRVSELARELGVESKTIIDYLESEGYGCYKASNKIEGYHEELIRNHFPVVKKEESEPVKPKAILREGNRERSFMPSDEREELVCPECKTELQGRGIVQCPTCGMTFCSKCMEQLPAGEEICPYCGNKKEQLKPEQEPASDNSTGIKISDLAKEIGVEPELICDYLSKQVLYDYTPDSKVTFLANEVRMHFQKHSVPPATQTKQPEDKQDTHVNPRTDNNGDTPDVPTYHPEDYTLYASSGTVHGCPKGHYRQEDYTDKTLKDFQGNKKEQPKLKKTKIVKPAEKPASDKSTGIEIIDLAKELNLQPEFICDYLHKLGYGYYAPVSKIPDSMANEVRAHFPYDPSRYTDKTLKDFQAKKTNPPASPKKSLLEQLKSWLGIKKK